MIGMHAGSTVVMTTISATTANTMMGRDSMDTATMTATRGRDGIMARVRAFAAAIREYQPAPGAAVRPPRRVAERHGAGLTWPDGLPVNWTAGGRESGW